MCRRNEFTMITPFPPKLVFSIFIKPRVFSTWQVHWIATRISLGPAWQQCQVYFGKKMQHKFASSHFKVQQSTHILLSHLCERLCTVLLQRLSNILTTKYFPVCQITHHHYHGLGQRTSNTVCHSIVCTTQKNCSILQVLSSSHRNWRTIILIIYNRPA